jgi:inner membrane protein
MLFGELNMIMWMFIGIALLVIELLSTTFFILFFGLAALTTAGIAYIWTIPLHDEILWFTICAFLYFICFRKLLKKKKKTPDTQDELIGQLARAYEDIMPHQLGKVMVGDTCWTATSTLPVQKGSQVKILAHHNLTLEVTPL